MSEKKKIKLAVFVSGRGSNLQAIIDAIEANQIDAVISFVLSDVENCYGLERARRHNLNTVFIDPGKYNRKENFDRAILEFLKIRPVELICLAGFMRLLTPLFIKEFPGKIMNIHPALLPSFPGLTAQKKALVHGVKISGCTVHFVDEGIDTGPIIIQAAVPVLETDTEETLAARILEVEHKIYPQAIQFFAEGRVSINNRQVTIKGIKEPVPTWPLIYPPLEIAF
jgi:phosphoribosylglycinamide formyltransferase-1